jgi:uncharacterized membrane protein
MHSLLGNLPLLLVLSACALEFYGLFHKRLAVKMAATYCCTAGALFTWLLWAVWIPTPSEYNEAQELLFSKHQQNATLGWYLMLVTTGLMWFIRKPKLSPVIRDGLEAVAVMFLITACLTLGGATMIGSWLVKT